MRCNLGWLALTTLALTPLGMPEARGGTITVHDESQINGGSFNDLTFANPIHAPWPVPLTIGSVTITPEGPYPSSGQPFNFWGPIVALSGAPGDGKGFGTYDSTDKGPAAPLVLDFSAPVAAFGVTFTHLSYWTTAPARLSVFDGPGGTGNLLGTILSSGYLESANGKFVDDFVGLWSDSRDIRSAVLVGDGSSHGFGVDGYAASIVPVPEPSALAVLVVAVAGLTLGRRAAGTSRV